MGISKVLTEFIGTFFLVLTVALAVATGSPVAGAAIGAMLMVMVYMGGHISGAHYNPAVTLAVFLRGRFSAADVGPYMIAQMLAGFFGAAAGAHLSGKLLVVAPSEHVTTLHAVLNEALFTFALCLVVLNVATLKKVAGNSYYGVAIGLTVGAAAIAGGGISGGAYNPAVGVGSLLFAAIKGTSIAHAWIYVVGPFGGAILAAAVFKVQNGNNPE